MKYTNCIGGPLDGSDRMSGPIRKVRTQSAAEAIHYLETIIAAYDLLLSSAEGGKKYTTCINGGIDPMGEFLLEIDAVIVESTEVIG